MGWGGQEILWGDCQRRTLPRQSRADSRKVAAWQATKGPHEEEADTRKEDAVRMESSEDSVSMVARGGGGTGRSLPTGQRGDPSSSEEKAGSRFKERGLQG